VKEILTPFLIYVFVTTFTPGPNNITAASMGMNYGYATALKCIFGIVSGFFCVAAICGFLTQTVILLFPKIENILRVLGTGYMVWLAFTILRAHKITENGIKPNTAFRRGLILQFINPKGIIYAITVFSNFLVLIISSNIELIAASLFLAFIAYLSTSLWALFGSSIKNYLQNKKIRLIFNISMALLLLYSAASIAGIQHLFNKS
jgi:threonine/homoserine/homoserine lactone efflux protein